MNAFSRYDFKITIILKSIEDTGRYKVLEHKFEKVNFRPTSYGMNTQMSYIKTNPIKKGYDSKYKFLCVFNFLLTQFNMVC